MYSGLKGGCLLKERRIGARKSGAIRILVACGNPIVREGVKHILSENLKMAVADEAGTGAEVFEKIREKDYDVVLLDVRIPDCDGLEHLKAMRKLAPSIPVLAITAHSEDGYGVRALRAGASGFVTETNATDELAQAIRTVLSGRRYISPAAAELLALSLDETVSRRPHEALSDREYQIMRYIASGRRLTDIADMLSLSIKTVSTYRSRILEKLEMKSNAELVRYSIENRLLE